MNCLNIAKTKLKSIDHLVIYLKLTQEIEEFTVYILIRKS